MKNTLHIIGSGFSALSSACYMAKAGYEVVVFEKNKQIGGRARQFKYDGFIFDMGPTWYWMPDVYEKFFNDFGYQTKDFYRLKRLNPAYRVYFETGDSFCISRNIEEIYDLFEREEQGSAKHLKLFLKQAKSNYSIAMENLVYCPGISSFELVNLKTITRLHLLFQSIEYQIRKKIKNPKLRKILEFPVLFLGAKPSDTPALYNFMNWADFGLGTWHPTGGMYQIIESMIKLAKELGVKFETNAAIEEILVQNSRVVGIVLNGEKKTTNILLSGADYRHTEMLLPIHYRQYSQKYWNKKVFAPSCLLFYVGFDKKLNNISHHTLFFDVDFETHTQAIYDRPEWPNQPLFYANFPSVSDHSFAPAGKETATFLIPIAPDLEDRKEIHEKYLEIILERIEKLINQEIKKHLLFAKSYCVNDFKKDYNAYKGNAYGLASILKQTAFLRPKIRSKKINNLFFTGQLTVPGPGVPPALISGKIAAQAILRTYKP